MFEFENVKKKYIFSHFIFLVKKIKINAKHVTRVNTLVSFSAKKYLTQIKICRKPRSSLMF